MCLLLVANLPKKIVLFYFIIIIFFMLLVIFEGGREGGDGSDKRGGCGLLGADLWPQQWSRSFLLYTVIEWRENVFLFYLEICDPWFFQFFF